MPRGLEINKVDVWYRNPANADERVEIIDDDGNYTGEFETSTSPIELYRMNVAPYASGLVAVRGALVAHGFGEFTEKSRTMHTSDIDCPIQEGAFVWIDGHPITEEPNYRVVKKSPSKHEIIYAIDEEIGDNSP